MSGSSRTCFDLNTLYSVITLIDISMRAGGYFQVLTFLSKLHLDLSNSWLKPFLSLNKLIFCDDLILSLIHWWFNWHGCLNNFVKNLLGFNFLLRFWFASVQLWGLRSSLFLKIVHVSPLVVGHFQLLSQLVQIFFGWNTLFRGRITRLRLSQIKRVNDSFALIFTHHRDSWITTVDSFNKRLWCMPTMQSRLW